MSVFLSLVSLPVFAQDRAYPLEFSDRTSGWVILVNDSQKPIEAFIIKATCGPTSTTTTYDGEDSAVHVLQARIAGIAAALRYWVNVQLSGHEQTVSANDPTNAENLSQDDLTKTWTYTCRDEPAVCSYWSGRRQVDQDVAHQMKHNAQMSLYLDRWTAKFDADVAFKTLEPIFPTPVTGRDAATTFSTAR